MSIHYSKCEIKINIIQGPFTNQMKTNIARRVCSLVQKFLLFIMLKTVYKD